MREVDQELFDAVEQGNLNRVQRCVNRGANIRAIKPVKRSPSLLSRVGGVVAYFMGYGNTPLDVAREKGHKEIVIYLLDEETTILCREREGEKALEAYKEMFDIQKDKLGRNHPDTLRTQYNMALALDSLYEWDKALRTYQEVFEKRRDVLGLDHPKTLETHNKIEKMREKIRRNEEQNLQLAREEKRRREKKEEWERERQASEPNVTYEDIQRQAEAYAQRKRLEAAAGAAQPGSYAYYRRTEHVRREEDDGCVIQSYQKQQRTYIYLSKFVSNNFQNASIKPVKQGLYLPSFEGRRVKINGKCVAITHGLSQALFSQNDKSFLNNLETSAKIYERIAQGKQVSKREEREVFAFSKLLDSFERKLGSSTSSLPSNLIHTQGYKTLDDLSNYIAEIKGNFAIHLVTSNHVVAIYRTGDNYAYFDSNVAFVSGLKSVDQLMEVVEKGVESAGYKVEKKGFLIEHFDVARANNQLPDEDKQVLTKEIKTERQLLAEQDKELGFIKINGQELSRVQLYDFGTKINVEGGVPLLINANMNLNSKKFQDHLDKKEISMTAREYLDNLENSKNVEEVVQATKVIPFIGSKSEIEEAEQTRKPLLEQLVKGTINSILAAVSLTSASWSKSQLPEKAGNEPQTYLNDPTVDKQQRSCQTISS